jgi:hypothetical protein
MAAKSLSVPYPSFRDNTGGPLESGYIYIGTENLNPETNAVSVYWDKALTEPAAQPIRTVAGFASFNGSARRLYVNEDDVSMTVKDKNGVLLYSALTITDLYSIDQFSGQIPATQVSFTQTGTGASARTADAEFREVIKVTQFGADPTGVVDATSSIQAAFDSVTSNANYEIVFPYGVYKISGAGVGIDVNSKTSLTVRGDGAIIRTPTGVTTSRPFVIRNSDFVEVYGLHFDCEIPLGASAQACNGLDIMNTTNAYIHDCNFTGQTFYGLGVFEDTIGGTDSSCAGLRVNNCNFKDIGSIALEAFPKVVAGSSVISNCVFNNCGNNVTGGGTGNAVKTGQGFDDATLTDCTFINCGSTTSAVAAGYYTRCVITNNTFSQCSNINIAYTVLEHTSGVNGTYESLIIDNNNFQGDTADAGSNGFMNVATDAAGIVIYDANNGQIHITSNTVQNTSTTRAFCLVRPSQNLNNFIFTGNTGLNLGNTMLNHDDANGGITVDAVISGNTVKMGDTSTSQAIIFINADGGMIVNNMITNTDQYGISVGVHTNSQFISGNKFWKCNTSATATRGAILLGTEGSYTPATVYLYDNVVVATEYAALVLTSVAYTINHANNVMPKLATTSSATEVPEMTFGAFTASGDVPTAGHISITDQDGNTRKLAVNS